MSNARYNEESAENPSPMDEVDNPELESLLYSRHVEVESFKDLTPQRGTPIPALFNNFYKFVQNPSTVSIETFKRMIDTDDTIGSGVDFLITCLAARLGTYQHPNKEISSFINKRLNEIDGGWTPAVRSLLAGTWSGFMVMEKVWANTENGFVPKKLVALPPSTILFEVDRTGELTFDGILQYQRNYNPAFFQSGSNYLFGFASYMLPADRAFKPDPFAKLGDFPYPLRTSNLFSYLAIRIPTAKCIHYAFDGQGGFGNPYGRSMLRRAYNFYVLKHAVLQMLAIALDRKGTPLTLVYADPNTTVIDANKYSSGTSAKGQRIGIRADQAARDAFRNIHNDTTIILPGKKGQIYDTDFVPQTSNANDFIETLRFCNMSLLRALLIPSLVFLGGDGSGAYALGQEHAKTFDKICDGMLEGAKQCLIQQLVHEMIAYNFPESMWKEDGLGTFGKRELTQDEINKEMEVIEKAVNIGAIDMNDMNDLNSIRDKMGLEPRETPIEKPQDESDENEDPAEADKNPPGDEDTE